MTADSDGPQDRQALPRVRWAGALAEAGVRMLPEETAVAIVHDASTTAVLMATPSNLEDLALGFSLTEGVVQAADQVREIEIVRNELGFEARVWLRPDRSQLLATRRRKMVGPTGCGLCGIDSLTEAHRLPRRVEAELQVKPDQLKVAMDALYAAQPLGKATRAVHAAAFWEPTTGALTVREDVGRHNALDKVVGAMARTAQNGSTGAVLLTSRVSVEMVQKTAALGAPVLCAVSVPTALAVRTAEAAGVTLVAVARQDGFEVFTHPNRVLL